MHEQGKNSSMSETRNSKLREVASTPIQTVTRQLHTTFPWLEPTHITMLGVAGVGGASMLAARAENTVQRVVSTATLITASVTDAFDGSLARLKESENPGTIDFKKGAIYDVTADRMQELFMAFSRALSANRRDDTLGKIAALLNGVSNPLPSLTKALAEKGGVTVPESGKGAIGFLGTRVGRAVLEIAETSFPEIKGKPFQLVADSVATYANITTSIDRLKRAYNDLPTLNLETRKDAEKRLKALTLFTGLAVGATLVAYSKLKEAQSIKVVEPAEQENERYLGAVESVEEYGNDNELNHRIVGGTVSGLFGPETRFEVDHENRRVKVLNPEPQKMRRANDTVTDIDLVVFTPDLDKFLQAREDFAFERKNVESFGYSYPNISVEAARHPGWRARSVAKQWVNAFEVDADNNLSLVFDDIKKPISWESVEPWTYEFDGIEITGLNPVAEALCYALRSPAGVKKKDQDVKEVIPHTLKMLNNQKVDMPMPIGFNKLAIVGRVAHQVIEQSKDPDTQESSVKEMYKPWIEYIHELRDSTSPSVAIKRFFMGIYWGHDFLGTDISQGTGLLGGLANLSNKFSG